VLACPPSKWYRLRKFAARRRAAFAVVSGLAAAVLLAVVALAASSVLVWRANDGLRQSLGREQTESYFQRITVSHRELTSSDNLGRALEVLDECPPPLRGWEWRYVKRLCRVEPLVLRDGGEVASVAFSPDGERLASAGADGAVKIWNSRTGKVVQVIPAHRGWALSVAFHPDGRHVVSAGADRQFRVWDLADGKEVFSGPCAPVRLFGGAYAVAFSPDGAKLAAGGDGALRVYDWRKRQLLRTLPDGQERAATLAFSRDGRRLASGTWAGAFKLWDGADGAEPLRSFPQDRFPVTALSFSPDGTRLAQGGFDRCVKVWDAATGMCVLPALRHTGIVGCVTFSPDGSRIASGGADKVVRLWDAMTGREVLDLAGHAEGCLCLAFSPDGNRLVSAGADGTIRLWDATPLRGDERQEASSFTRHDDEVWRVALSPGGGQIASGGFRTPAKVWDSASGRVVAEFNGHPFVCFDLSWRPDGARIASAGFNGARFAVKVWESQTGHDVFSVAAPAEVYAAEYSPDGRHLAMAGMGRAIQVLDADSGRLLATLGTHAREIRGLAFSRDGRHLASEGGDGEIKLWDGARLTDKQEPRVTLRARVPGQCLNVAFSPDGTRIATGGEDNTVKVWDVQTGRLLHTLRGHSADVFTVAFSPGDGYLLASAGEDSTVKIWDTRTAKLVRSFRGHTGPVSSVAFGPDGRTLYSGSRDHTVKTWDLASLEALSPSAPSTRPSP
jgi:eukaryotic-like serine/threonine-protein kinase